MPIMACFGQCRSQWDTTGASSPDSQFGGGGVWVHFPEQHLVYMRSYIEPNICLHVSSYFFY